MAEKDSNKWQMEVVTVCQIFLMKPLIFIILEYGKLAWSGEKIRYFNFRGKPWGITRNFELLFIADELYSQIFTYSLATFQPLEPLQLFLFEPTCLEIMDETDLYIVDNKNLLIYDISQKVIKKQWPIPSSSHGLKVTKEEIYISASLMNEIVVYNHEGKELRKLGKNHAGMKKEVNKEVKEKETELDLLNFPCGLAIDEKHIFICDSRHDCIQVLNRFTGQFRYQFGEQNPSDWQFDKGQISNPVSIVLSSEGLLYIGSNNGVDVFTKGGKFVFRFGTISERTGWDRSQSDEMLKEKRKNEIGFISGLTFYEEQLITGDRDKREVQVWK